MCSCLGKGSRNVQKTPGGLIFRQRWNNMQFVTSASFLATVYSDYLASSGRNLRCNSGNVAPAELLSLAKSQVIQPPAFHFLVRVLESKFQWELKLAMLNLQVDYLLGNNPRATSYMVGYGNNFPQRVHHRGSSIVSIKVNPSFVSCRGGYDTWFSSKRSDPNLLTGALVGGPDAYDDFADERDNYEQTEPATYNNAPLIGILARLNGGHGGYNQLLPGIATINLALCLFQFTLFDNVVISFDIFLAVVPAPKPVVINPRPSPNTKTTPSPGTVCLVTSLIHLHTVYCLINR